MKCRSIGFVLALLMVSYLTSFGQENKQIELIRAEYLAYDEQLGAGAKRLLGDVQFKHQGALLFCDSAYYFADNRLDAFGSVRLIQGDSLRLTCSTLHYNGNTREAFAERNVVLSNGKMVLQTAALNYDLQNGIARYDTPGKITDKENVLTSGRGVYMTKTRWVYFHRNVRLKNPRYRIESDTLHYQTNLETAHFVGPTEIFGDQSRMQCTRGWYDTRNDRCHFWNRAHLWKRGQEIIGDSLWYNQLAGEGRGRGNVELLDTSEHIRISAQKGDFEDSRDRAVFTQKSWLEQYDKQDTLFLSGDTLVATYDSVYFAAKAKHDKRFGAPKQKSGTGKGRESTKTKDKKKETAASSRPERFQNDSLASRHRRFQAYRNVLFFRKDMQGKADSMVYGQVDSLMHLFGKPVLWNEENQLVGDRIRILMSDGKIFRMWLYGSAFISSEIDTARYNQIKGRNIDGFFIKNALRKVLVRGNGESVYAARDEKGAFIGINTAACSDMCIFIKENKVERITMLSKPDATMHPVKTIPRESLRLPGFQWRSAERPKGMWDVVPR
jgi:hypothetical protein